MVDWPNYTYYNGYGHVSVNGKLEMSRFEGGYFDADGNAHYYLTDYQGNVVRVIDREGSGGQPMDYYPYGEPWQEWDWARADTYPTFIKNRFLYGGKERITQFGLGLYNFEARMYRAPLGRFSTPDKKAIDTPWLSPFAYCACNPVNAIDPDGNLLIFINGHIDFGAPPAGKSYWNNSFVNGAMEYFSDRKIFFSDRDYGKFSSARGRTAAGYEYAKETYPTWKAHMDKGETFKLLSHSMGTAFSKGVEKYIKEMGGDVTYNVMLNSYQIDDIDNTKNNGTFDIDYKNTNDPVIRGLDDWFGTEDLKNADLKIREKSDLDFGEIHRTPIDKGRSFWNTLKKYITLL